MIIQHASENWENFVPKKVKTLILGSFNPLNPNGNNANYYYGRNTNYLWKAIGDILHDNQQYFFENGTLNNELAFRAMEENDFFFMDLVKQISIIGINEDFIQNFADNKIYTNFNDNELFRVGVMEFNTQITRYYNCKIIEFIQSYKPQKVIHTLGNSRINLALNAMPNELKYFFNQIISISREVNTQIVPLSISPSQTNINRNGNYEVLKNWLQENLEL